MRRPLIPHPDFACEAVTRLRVEIARPQPGRLTLRYLIDGAIAALRLPPPAAPERADELWRRTCFEAFVRPGDGEAYLEFNFSPSSHWAAYRFDTYRAGMSTPPEAAAPVIATRRTARRFALEASLALEPLLGAACGEPWRIGVSAVIETADGGKSYWALTHPPGRADFHHADGFALALPPAEPA